MQREAKSGQGLPFRSKGRPIVGERGPELVILRRARRGWSQFLERLRSISGDRCPLGELSERRQRDGWRRRLLNNVGFRRRPTDEERRLALLRDPVFRSAVLEVVRDAHARGHLRLN